MSFNNTGPTYDIGARVVLKDKRAGEIIGVDDSTDKYLILTDEGDTVNIGYNEIQQEVDQSDPNKRHSSDNPADDTKLARTIDSPLISGYQDSQSNIQDDAPVN